jgi:putative copper resistance protein D
VASPLALAALRRSVALEAAAGVAILALVAWLGTLDPIAGM